LFTSEKAYPALLLTAVRLFTPVFSKLFIRFSGIPHSPKPVNEGKEIIKKILISMTSSAIYQAGCSVQI